MGDQPPVVRIGLSLDEVDESFFGFMTSATLGGTLHILLVVAIILFLVHIIQGRSIGNA